MVAFGVRLCSFSAVTDFEYELVYFCLNITLMRLLFVAWILHYVVQEMFFFHYMTVGKNCTRNWNIKWVWLMPTGQNVNFLSSSRYFQTQLKMSFYLTSYEEISVEFACDTTANIICVLCVGGELSGIWNVPKSTSIVIRPCEDLVTIWGEVC